MKKLALIGTALSLALATQIVSAAADQAVGDDEIGLSRTSVYDAPAPQTFQYPSNAPFSSQVLPRAYQGAPPQVPHDISNLVPIKRDNNMCISCHQQPAMIGQKTKGQPTPLPASHYLSVKNNSLNMGRFVCTQCHTPQANVKPLVGNTFTKTK